MDFFEGRKRGIIRSRYVKRSASMSFQLGGCRLTRYRHGRILVMNFIVYPAAEAVKHKESERG